MKQALTEIGIMFSLLGLIASVFFLLGGSRVGCAGETELDSSVHVVNGKKICPVCKKNGMKSTVRGGVSDCPAVYREQGHYNEDGNWEANAQPPVPCKYNYTCSKGHYWTETK